MSSGPTEMVEVIGGSPVPVSPIVRGSVISPAMAASVARATRSRHADPMVFPSDGAAVPRPPSADDAAAAGGSSADDCSETAFAGNGSFQGQRSSNHSASTLGVAHILSGHRFVPVLSRGTSDIRSRHSAAAAAAAAGASASVASETMRPSGSLTPDRRRRSSSAVTARPGENHEPHEPPQRRESYLRRVALQADDETVTHPGGEADGPASPQGPTLTPQPASAAAILRQRAAQRLRRFGRRYMKRLRAWDQTQAPFGFFVTRDSFLSLLSSAIAMLIIGTIQRFGFEPLQRQVNLLIPSFGASCALLFAVPRAPLSQPRSLFLGHLMAAVLGVSLANIFDGVEKPLGGQIAGVLGTGILIVAMQCTGTIHPPAGATLLVACQQPFNGYYQDRGWLFVLTPVLLGCTILFVVAFLFNNLFSNRAPYPQYW